MNSMMRDAVVGAALQECRCVKVVEEAAGKDWLAMPLLSTPQPPRLAVLGA